MRKCLIIINNNAGGCNKISFAAVEKCLGGEFFYSHATLPRDELDFEGFDAVAVCGGDGTLSTVLQELYTKKIEVFYFPAGTLNDKAKAERYEKAKRECVSCADNPAPSGESVVIGKVNGKIFTYVTAAGSFTPIGYEAEIKYKKKYGVLAYIGKVFREFKIHAIPAKIYANGKEYKGNFTLLMLLRSPRCFGFNFNRAYDENKVTGHLVAIRTPKFGGLIGYIELFRMFFRVFFIGLKREREGKILFCEIADADIKLDGEYEFCHDGELQLFKNRMRVVFEKTACKLSVFDTLR